MSSRVATCPSNSIALAERLQPEDDAKAAEELAVVKQENNVDQPQEEADLADAEQTPEQEAQVAGIEHAEMLSETEPGFNVPISLTQDALPGPSHDPEMLAEMSPSVAELPQEPPIASAKEDDEVIDTSGPPQYEDVLPAGVAKVTQPDQDAAEEPHEEEAAGERLLKAPGMAVEDANRPHVEAGVPLDNSADRN